jgi:hypothetical protein
MTPTVFKINQNHHLLINCGEKCDIVDKIIEIAETEEKVKFDSKSLNNQIDSTIVHFVSYKSKDDSISDWYNFLAEGVESIEEDSFEETKVSIVIFFEDYNYLYCITGGSGYNLVKKFIDYDFGLNIYSRIYNPTHQIKNLETRNISGLLYNSNNQYATNFNAENLTFTDKIIQKLTVELNESQDFFSLKNDFQGGLVLKFDSGVQLKNTINLNQLVSLISDLDQVFQFEPKFEISNYTLIDDESIKDQLNNKLVEELRNDFSNIERNVQRNERSLAFEFCSHSNVQAFYDSNAYSFDYKKKSTATDRKSFKQYNINEIDILFLSGMNYLFNAQIIDHSSLNYKIKAELMNLGLVYYSGGVQKRSPFFYSINTEIEFEGSKYFFVNSKWYKLSASIQNNLNQGLQQIFQNFELPNLYQLNQWDTEFYKNEGEYNLAHLDEDILILDRCIIDNIELCDILRFDHENKQILLYHVKQKFAHDIRVLCNQINMAAKKLTYVKNGNDTTYFENLLVSRNFKKSNPLSTSTSEDLLEYFENYKIAFVFAVTGNKRNSAIKTNANEYASSIAKFSIIELQQVFKSSYDYELYYQQIVVV